jgi:Glyoxalase-like domain
MLTSGVVVLGVTDRQRAGQFWSAAPDIRPGTGRPAAGPGCWPRRRGQAGSVLAPQTSRTDPQDYPRLLFGLHVNGTTGQEAEGARLVSLGASRVGWDSFPDDPDVVVLADPEGNRFCIVDLDHDSA